MSREYYARDCEIEIDVNDAIKTRGGCIGAIPILGPRHDDGTREPSNEAQWILGGLSEPIEHGERIASGGATVRTMASYHEIVATMALWTKRGSPELTVLDAKRFEDAEARRKGAEQEIAILEIEAMFPRRTEAGDEAIDRLLRACLEGKATVVAGDVGRDARTGQVHATEGTTIHHPRLPETELSGLDPDKVHVQCFGAQVA